MVEFTKLFQAINGKPGHCEKALKNHLYGMTVHELAVKIRKEKGTRKDCSLWR